MREVSGMHVRCILTRCSRCVPDLFKRYLEAELYRNPTTVNMEFSPKTSLCSTAALYDNVLAGCMYSMHILNLLRNLYTGSTKFQKSLNHENDDKCSIPDFGKFEDISKAFIQLLSGISKHLRGSKFFDLRRACLAQMKTPSGAKLSPNVIRKIKNTKNLDELLDALVDTPYCSWIDLRLLEALVNASDSTMADTLLSSYKSAIFSKKLCDALPSIPIKEDEEGFYSKMVAKVGKRADEITVNDLLKFQSQLEAVIMDIGEGTCTLAHFKDGCIKIHYYIPTHCTEHAFNSAAMKCHKFHELSLLHIQIGSFPVIYDPLSVCLSQPNIKEPLPPVSAGKTFLCYQGSKLYSMFTCKNLALYFEIYFQFAKQITATMQTFF